MNRKIVSSLTDTVMAQYVDDSGRQLTGYDDDVARDYKGSEPKEGISADGTTGYKTLANGEKFFYDIETFSDLFHDPEPVILRAGEGTLRPINTADLLGQAKMKKITCADIAEQPMAEWSLGVRVPVKELVEDTQHFMRNALSILLCAQELGPEHYEFIIRDATELLQEFDKKYKGGE